MAIPALLFPIIGNIVAKIIANRLTENTIGRVVPEVVNVGRRIRAKNTRTEFVPLQDEIATLKSRRTLLGAAALVVLHLLDMGGIYHADEEVHRLIFDIMVGTFTLKLTEVPRLIRLVMSGIRNR